MTRHVAILLLTVWLTAAVSCRKAPPDAETVDCGMRRLAMSMGLRLRAGTSAALADDLHDALRLHECNPALPVQAAALALRVGVLPHRLSAQSATSRAGAEPSARTGAPSLTVSPSGNDDNPGTPELPLRTLSRARDLLRSLRASGAAETSARGLARVMLRAGTYFLDETFTLGPEDSGTEYAAHPGENVVISGGAPVELALHAVGPTRTGRGHLYSGHAPAFVGRNITQLFLSTAADAAAVEMDATFPAAARASGLGPPLTWARSPNGQAERDLQPTGYAQVIDNANGTTVPQTPGYHVQVDTPSCNSSIFPVFGRDHDPRTPNGYVWYHEGGMADRFDPPANFWNSSVDLGLRFNRTGGEAYGRRLAPFTTANWTLTGREVAHVFHEALWGNWFYNVDGHDDASSTLTFSQGGWQEGRAGGMKNQPFFVEGVKETLDSPGEWWLDDDTGALGLVFNTTNPKLNITVVAPVLFRLVEIIGTDVAPATDISFSGIIFAHSRHSYMQRYMVPSAGDWSIHAGGAVFLEGVRAVQVDNCTFVRPGGNAVFGHKGVADSSVTNSNFVLVGDSAVALVGSIDLNDGYTVTSYPQNVTVEGNYFGGVGVVGKQTSALFLALACNITFANNIAFNGPRAGVNINDGFCGGHLIHHNLLFNWVRETQDHGPINTWNRQCYIQPKAVGAENMTTTPKWTHISQNLIMNGPSGNRDLGNLFPSVDNDDGSAYFRIAQNVVAYGGFKNYLGHDKVWAGNMMVYPDRWSGSCLVAWGGEGHAYVNNTCIINSSSAVQFDPRSSGIGPCDMDYSNLTKRANIPATENNRYFTPDGTWAVSCGQTLNISQVQSMGAERGSVVEKGVPADWLMQAQALLTQS